MKVPALKTVVSKVRSNKGFTLIELLVVIGILAVLLAIVLIAINPARQFSQANDTQRKSDVNAILNAVHQYMAENAGAPPAAITQTATEISDGAGLVDLCDDLVPTYIAGLPVDPSTGADPVTDCTTAYATGYTIIESSSSSRITVSAPSAENSVISVTR